MAILKKRSKKEKSNGEWGGGGGGGLHCYLQKTCKGQCTTLSIMPKTQQCTTLSIVPKIQHHEHEHTIKKRKAPLLQQKNDAASLWHQL